MHARARIRDAIFRKLKAQASDGAFPTSAGGRIFKSRMVPVDVNDDEELPAILVYARDESRDPNRDYGPDAEDSFVRSHLCVVVEAIVRGGTTVDDKLDAIAMQIEAALEDWEIPGFEGATMRQGDTDIDVIAENTKKPVGAIGVVWHISYTRPWRERPAGTRPNTVDVRMNGGPAERIITNDRGLANPPRAAVSDEAEDIVSGLPSFLAGRGL